MILPPPRRVPPIRPTFPPLPAAPLPCLPFLSPHAPATPQAAALPRRYADPRSASLRSGDGRPRFSHGPAAGAAWRVLRRGLAIPRPAVTPSASTAGLRVELARWRSLASASGVALGVKIGGVHHASSVVLRGVLPRSSALRASGGGARLDAVRGSSPRAQPRLRSALRLRLRLRASFKSAEDGGFPTPLVRPRLPRPFFGLILAL